MPYRDEILLALLLAGSVAVGFAWGFRFCAKRMGRLLVALSPPTPTPTPALACAVDLLELHSGAMVNVDRIRKYQQQSTSTVH